MKPYTATDYEVRAFLEGRKTQFRVPVEPQPPSRPFQVYGDRSRDWYVENHGERHVSGLFGSWRQSSPYQPGDRLWVREDWAAVSTFDPSPETGALYRSDPVWGNAVVEWEWEASESMPQWASRITLEVENVRVQKLQDISEEDANREGVACSDCWTSGTPYENFPHDERCGCVNKFGNLWNERHPTRPWDANPWTWCYKVKVIGEHK